MNQGIYEGISQSMNHHETSPTKGFTKGPYGNKLVAALAMPLQ